MADEPSAERTRADARSAGGSGDAGLRGRDLIGLGGLLVGSIVVFTLLGIVVDDAAGTAPVLTVTGVFLGMALGALGFALRVRAASR